MTKKERNAIIEEMKSLSDEELEKEYYMGVYDSLGSDTERMYELGYDIRDIEESERHKKYLMQRCDLIEELCQKRGIKLWESN